MNFVAGDAALKFDPMDVNSITHAITQIVESPELQQDLRERGRTHARGFTWARAAQKTLQVYDSLLYV